MGIVQKDGFKLTIVSYIGVVIGYVNKVLLFPNLLRPDEVGLANTLISVAALYAQFAALGMTGVTLKFFPFFQDKERKHHGFLYWASLIVAVGFIITSICFLFLKPLVVRKFSANSPMLLEYYYYLIPLGLAAVYYNLFDSYLRSLMKTVVSSFVNEVFIRLLVTVSILLYAMHLVDFKQFVFIYVIFNCLHALTLVFYMIYLKQWSFKPLKSFRIQKLKKPMLYFGLFSILSNTGNTFIANVDALMIASLVKDGLYFTGIYTTVFFISTVMLIPYRSMLKVTSTLVSNYWKDRDMVKMEALYKKVTISNMLIGGFIFLILWINIDGLFSFMPKEYASGKYVFLFIGLGRLFDMTTGLNGIITVTSNKFKYDLIFTALLVVLTVVLNYLFIRTFDLGMNGAAVAAMITLFIYNILRLIFVQYSFKMQPFTLKCLWVLLLGIFCLGIDYLIPKQANVILDGLVRSVPIVVVYGTAALYFKLSSDVNDFLYKILPQSKRWFN